MLKESTVSNANGSVWLELFQFGLYKPTQGKVARQATGWVLAVSCALAAWRLFGYLIEQPEAVRFGLPGLLLLGGAWVSYRLVNWPKFADFLIAVEAEMHKVSWPSWPELVRSSIVVIVCLLILGVGMALLDALWIFVFKWINVIRF